MRNLRKDDLFSLVTFDDSAQTIIPLAPIQNKMKSLIRFENSPYEDAPILEAGGACPG